MDENTTEPPSIEEIDRRLQRLVLLASSDASDAQLIVHARAMMAGFVTRVYQEDAGTMYVRCRRVELADGANPTAPSNYSCLPTRRRDFWHPPTQCAKLNRANFDGESVFYCSTKVSSALYEMRAGTGEFYVIGYWQMRAHAMLQNIGLSPTVLTDLGCIDARMLSEADGHVSSGLDELSLHFYTELSKMFADQISLGADVKYRVTAAISAALIAGSILRSESSTQVLGQFSEFSGLSYPGMQVSGNATNYVFKPNIVEESFDLMRLDLVRVNAVDEGAISMSFHGFARCHAPEQLQWTLTEAYEIGSANRRNGPAVFGVVDGRLAVVDISALSVEPEKVAFL